MARAMPNTPGQIGCGVTVWTAGRAQRSSFTDADIERCKGALGALGKEIYVEEESYVDMSTSISGSGPAYIFLLIEAMVDAGSKRASRAKSQQFWCIRPSSAPSSTRWSPASTPRSSRTPSLLLLVLASAIYELEKGNFRTVVQDADLGLLPALSRRWAAG